MPECALEMKKVFVHFIGRFNQLFAVKIGSQHTRSAAPAISEQYDNAKQHDVMGCFRTAKYQYKSGRSVFNGIVY